MTAEKFEKEGNVNRKIQDGGNIVTIAKQWRSQRIIWSYKCKFSVFIDCIRINF